MKFKELRERAKMRQAELGTEVGVGQTTVSAWESGRFEPRAREIKKIARVLGASVEEVVDCFAGEEEE